MFRVQFSLVSALCVAVLSLPAHATLIDRGNGLIYDTVLDITWLQNANLAQEQLGEPDGVTWQQAVDWAQNLVYQGYSDWRLPRMSDTSPAGFLDVVDCGSVSAAACAAAGNELGYMYYYNLGGTFGDDLTGDQGLIHNIQSVHWSGTEFAPDGSYASAFDFGGGFQNFYDKDFYNHGAWAVRPGNVLAAVPAPPTLLLFLAGLAGLGWGVRRRAGRTSTQ